MTIQTTLPENEIKCELSNAYVHAVASRLGCRVQWSGRQYDNLGIDAKLCFQGNFNNLPVAISRVEIDIQVKSTSQYIELDQKGRIIFDGLTKNVYNQFRASNNPIPCFIVLFVLPNNAEEWLCLSEDELILKKCAYWVSLKGADECTGDTKRIFFPQTQLFNIEQLEHIITTLAQEGEFCYDK